MGFIFIFHLNFLFAKDSFNSRFVETKFYYTKSKDTLQSISIFLYGHEKWWSYIKKQNKNLISYANDTLLPEGLKIAYLAPSINHRYQVQRNDTLSRIAYWKFGNAKLWEKIFQLNRDQISNPNLILPGEWLLFDHDGNVKQEANSNILIRGLESNKRSHDLNMSFRKELSSNDWSDLILYASLIMLLIRRSVRSRIKKSRAKKNLKTPGIRFLSRYPYEFEIPNKIEVHSLDQNFLEDSTRQKRVS
jgi:hypothetical protein